MRRVQQIGCRKSLVVGSLYSRTHAKDFNIRKHLMKCIPASVARPCLGLSDVAGPFPSLFKRLDLQDQLRPGLTSTSDAIMSEIGKTQLCMQQSSQKEV